jgi:hypothetical protein
VEPPVPAAPVFKPPADEQPATSNASPRSEALTTKMIVGAPRMRQRADVTNMFTSRHGIVAVPRRGPSLPDEVSTVLLGGVQRGIGAL